MSCLICGNDTYKNSGLDRFEARKKLWADLEETGLAVKKEPHTLRVPRSQRGGEVRQ
jgi:valyl-tRNA synthetase